VEDEVIKQNWIFSIVSQIWSSLYDFRGENPYRRVPDC
jgi:hypothetical protein